MTEEESKCIVDAIDRMEKRTKGDRVFAYILLLVITFAISIVVYDLHKLITALSNDMRSISTDIHAMRTDMGTISGNIESMDLSFSIIATDVHKAVETHDIISKDVNQLKKNINQLQEDITDMNKLNPIRKIF